MNYGKHKHKAIQYLINKGYTILILNNRYHICYNAEGDEYGLDNDATDKMVVEVKDITDHIVDLGEGSMGTEFINLIEKGAVFEIAFSKTTPWLMYSKPTN